MLFKNIKQYTQLVKDIRFPIDRKNPYLLAYFSENSLFVDDYLKLNIRRTDVRTVIVPLTKIPRTRLDTKLRDEYKKIGLIPYSSHMKFPQDRSEFLDLTNYINTLDEKYHPQNYRQRAGMLLTSFIDGNISSFPQKYRKILIYSIDVTKKFSTFINRKFFPLMRQMKDGNIVFDDLILCLIQGDIVNYRLLVKDGVYKFSRVFQYLKSIKGIDLVDIDTEQEKEEIDQAANIVVNSISKEISPGNLKKTKESVKDYLKKNQNKVEKIISGEVPKNELKRISVTSVMYKVSSDVSKSTKISQKIPDKKLDITIKAIDKKYVDNILEPEETVSYSTNVVSESSSIPDRIDHKTPEHIFKKRQVDFEINLKNDVERTFKLLENKEIPIKTVGITIVDKPIKTGEIAKSDESTLKANLKDEFGNEHHIEITIPKIDPVSGTFRVSGQKKCLLNQIVVCPISFPQPYDSKFESSFSIFHIESKRTKTEKYLRVYIGSYWIPLFVILSFAFGFEETLKRYKLSYRISSKKTKDDLFAIKISPTEYLIFDNVDSEFKEELCKSFTREKDISNLDIDGIFGSKEYFQNMIIKMTGRVNSISRISSCIENIVDPVAIQVLVNKQLPTDLETIMEYMSRKVVTGFFQRRNDLSNQRIRNSEVLVHLLQKQILSAYTEYREQVLSGNKDAKFYIQPEKLMSQFVNLDLVTNMEYSNPIEEMSSITRISPIGKGISGIPDKRAIQVKDRSVDPSYFGNVDPVDTPEGDTIGISQQLTVNALITSSRGLIMTKNEDDNERSGILSTTSSMIPFIECNDGARMMMATSQAKQIVPLKNPTPPAVQSGYENVLTNVLSDSFIKKSPCAGKIEDVKQDSITILCKDGKKSNVDITPVHLKSGSGKNTLSTFVPKVSKGQQVRENNIIAEGACISNGTIAMGRTLLVALMPYRGYNFEDGIVLSESIVENDKLTSLHGIVEEVTLSKSDRLITMANIGDKTKKGDIIFNKTIGEIDEIIGYEESEEEEGISIVSGQYIKKSPGGTIVDIEVFSNLSEDSFPRLTELIRKTNKKYKKIPKEKYIVRGISVKGILIVFKIEQELKVDVGDKLCNRYGNKGIISLIEKDNLMPRTPWGDKVEIILNPLGLINRMNLGQLYELYTGLISKSLANISLQLRDKTKIVQLFGNVYSALDTSPNKKFSAKMIQSLSRLSNDKFNLMMEQIRNNGFVPIIASPFKSPKYKQIQSAFKILKLNPSYQLYLPYYGVKTKSPVPIGYTYINKLEHIGEMKVTSRSTGPSVAKTQQPTAGKARFGGQRIGEGDTYSLLSYNCPYLLEEEFGPLSDDHMTKNEIISDIILTGKGKYRKPKTSPTLQLLNSYFVALMLGKGS
jgi:DNA-directed RNA polymerase beta subunit